MTRKTVYDMPDEDGSEPLEHREPSFPEKVNELSGLGFQESITPMLDQIDAPLNFAA